MSEYVLLWMRPRATTVNVLSLLAHLQHERLRSTWRVVVLLALINLGGQSSLEKLYVKVTENALDRLAQNEHWQAKARQVLQKYADFISINRGVWAIA